jgi:hypothetical protein
MIDVRQAADAAARSLVSLFPEQALANVQLEEVELTDDEKYWLITLSYPLTQKIAVLNLPVIKREYKLFKVDTQTGQVRAMKIRKLD